VAGLCVCLLLVDFIGRRRCLLLFLVASCGVLAPFLRQHGPTIAKAANLARPNVSNVDVTFLFLSRLTSYAAFIVTFIYTPEVYPTRVRSFAFGIFNAASRIGGLVAPFIGVDLFEKVRTSSL
jgi:hypothetical protein